MFYLWDALGRRVGRTANSSTTIYFQNGQQTLADYVSGTSATAFRCFKEHSQGLTLTLANCPLSDEGLRMLVQCRALQSLTLSFLRNCESIPNLRILLDGSPSVEVYVEVGKECVDPHLDGILSELDEHFTNFSWFAL